MSNPNGCPFVHSQPVPNFAIRCPYCDYVTPPAEPGTFITLNAARAEARPAPVVDREAVARVLSPEAFYGVSQWMDRLYLNQIDALDEVQRWAKARFDAKKKADAILALLSPATSPGEGSSSANRAARIASDHAASETLRKSEEG